MKCVKSLVALMVFGAATLTLPNAAGDLHAEVSAEVEGLQDPGRAMQEANNNVQHPEDALMRYFAFSPAGDGTVFGAGRNRECPTAQVFCPAVLFRSNDGGATWTRLPGDGFDGHTILLPPTFPKGDRRIFAASFLTGLHVSKDGGLTFEPAGVPPAAHRGLVDISPGFNSGDPRIVIGSEVRFPPIYEYRDDRKTILPAPYAFPGAIAFDSPVFATPDLLMIGGLAREGDRWKSFVFRCENIVCTGTKLIDTTVSPSLRLAPDFVSSGVMYAFTQTNLLQSMDGGATFSLLRTPWTDAYLRDVALTRNGKWLVAATTTSESNGQEGLYLSKDAGLSWQRLEGSAVERSFSAVSVAGRRVLAAPSEGGVVCSINLGESWATRCPPARTP